MHNQGLIKLEVTGLFDPPLFSIENQIILLPVQFLVKLQPNQVLLIKQPVSFF